MVQNMHCIGDDTIPKEYSLFLGIFSKVICIKMLSPWGGSKMYILVYIQKYMYISESSCPLIAG